MLLPGQALRVQADLRVNSQDVVPEALAKQGFVSRDRRLGDLLGFWLSG